jgi:hypothetical protein
MRLSLTLIQTQRHSLIHELGIKSELLEACLPASEQLLRTRAGQRGLGLLRHACDRDPIAYRSVLDFLLVLCSPTWRAPVEAYYADRGSRLIEFADAATIASLDLGIARCLVELGAVHAACTSLGWQASDLSQELEALALDGIRHFITPDMPLAPAVLSCTAA